ncbi:hypothetical protein A4S02_14040 (plasmid) [Acetobacter ascendens]|uniref:Uncharacterized protein n=1 Tax=Acetobacter ascendens TaxID=481146 RepID=A0A1D8R042_9PROT|nr:hypothetical protein [Acetobacter ascendens]AOW47956.1 hypothetical protein A4S02_14040 [Acetobacter ascendens]
MLIDRYQNYLNDRILELKTAQHIKSKDDRLNGSIWDFVLMGCLVELVAKLNCVDSINTFEKVSKLFDERLPKYRAPFYNTPEKINDVPEQIYMVMRCGLIHSLSLIPDKKVKDKDIYKRHWREVSLVLTHRGNHLKMGKTPHNGSLVEVCQLDYSTMLDDMQTALDAIFQDAKHDTALSSHIEKFVKENPTLSFVPFLPQDT